MSKIQIHKIVKPFCVLALAAVYVCTGSGKSPESFLAARSAFYKKSDKREKVDLNNPDFLERKIVELRRVTGAPNTPILRYVAVFNLIQKEIVASKEPSLQRDDFLKQRWQLTLNQAITPQEIYQFLKEHQTDSSLFPYVETLEALYVEMILRLKKLEKDWPVKGKFNRGSEELSRNKFYNTLFSDLLKVDSLAAIPALSKEEGEEIKTIKVVNIAHCRQLFTVILVHLLGEVIFNFPGHAQTRLKNSFEGESYHIAKNHPVDVWLQQADLKETNLTSANLQECDLRWSDLNGANLSNATLYKAKLEGSNLKNANLHQAKVTDEEHDRLKEEKHLAYPLTPEQLAQFKIFREAHYRGLILGQAWPLLIFFPNLYELEGWAVGLVHLGLTAALGASFLCLLYFWIWLNEYFAQRQTQQRPLAPAPPPIPARRAVDKLYFPHTPPFDMAL